MSKINAKILQFKITLSGSKPAIWRIFQMENSKTFFDLHLVIQHVMGWSNSHLYQFEDGDENYIGNPEMLDDPGVDHDKKIKLSARFNEPANGMLYLYDFGDSWEHEIVLEKILEKEPGKTYPFCLDGAMNCPPEDCGGIYGFYELLKILKNKKHPDYEDMSEWIGTDYDWKYFDAKIVSMELKNYK